MKVKGDSAQFGVAPFRWQAGTKADPCPICAQPGGEAGGIEWTAVHGSEHCNRLPFKRLGSEVQRHQPLVRTRGSEFESLPPSQPNSLLLRDLRLSWINHSPSLPK
jgi:hypothetical protein